MNALKIVKYSLLATLIAVIGMLLHYNLPRTDVVQLTGTDVKRMDSKKPQQGTGTRDVRYLNAVSRDGKIRVYRNDDTGWGWPPYLKFNSADLTAEAQRLLQSPDKPWVRIRYYGWRINVFSLFPNAISLKVVDKDYTHIPWFNITFITLLAVGTVVVARILRRLVARLRGSERYQKISQSIRDRTDQKER
jgi:hypothetical protein